MSSKPIQLAWGLFADQAIPESASATQRQEMRRAFFSGAGFMFQRLVSRQLTEPPLREVMASIEVIKHELDVFNSTVGSSLEGRV